MGIFMNVMITKYLLTPSSKFTTFPKECGIFRVHSLQGNNNNLQSLQVIENLVLLALWVPE